MDALEEYVCPLATSELILLPVTGLECVGDRLLAGEAWLEARQGERGKETAPARGGATGTKGCPEERKGSRLRPVGGEKGAQETAGTRANLRTAGPERQS